MKDSFRSIHIDYENTDYKHYSVFVSMNRMCLAAEVLAWLDVAKKGYNPYHTKIIINANSFYEWQQFINLICADGDESTLPDWIAKTPIDFNTILNDYEVDLRVFSRNIKYDDEYDMNKIPRDDIIYCNDLPKLVKSTKVFSSFKDKYNNNPLWTATFVEICNIWAHNWTEVNFNNPDKSVRDEIMSLFRLEPFNIDKGYLEVAGLQYDEPKEDTNDSPTKKLDPVMKPSSSKGFEKLVLKKLILK
jgi:hypothetical protein